jgi:thiosulfate reductase cytochrome b subunit
MADSVWGVSAAAAPAAARERLRHPAVVRVAHWIVTLSFLALLVTGVEILISHPRLYWGETGNVHTRPLIRFPIPASRATVPTGYGYVLPDQNGWSRYLHFQSAWALVVTGLVYVAWGVARGHFRREMVPRRGAQGSDWSYNPLQRVTYLSVIFALFPLVIWTGLAMSPAVASAIPAAVTVWGGQQSARTIHFFVSVLLALFLAVHLAKVWRAGFGRRTGAMITGRLRARKEEQ